MDKIKNKVTYVIILSQIIIMYNVKKMRKAKERLLVKEEYMQKQKMFYKALLQKEEITKRYRHDMNEHLLYISFLAEKSGNKKLMEYTKELCGEMKTIRTMTYEFGNDIANVLINYYIGQIKETAEIEIYGAWVGANEINNYDLCIIIGNIMKNAVREISEDKGKRKYLNIQMTEDDEEIKMIVKNSCRRTGIEIERDMLPKTTKSDKKAHGIGLRNVKKTVEKNGGIFKWKCEDGYFSVMLTIRKTI